MYYMYMITYKYLLGICSVKVVYHAVCHSYKFRLNYLSSSFIVDYLCQFLLNKL